MGVRADVNFHVLLEVHLLPVAVPANGAAERLLAGVGFLVGFQVASLQEQPAAARVRAAERPDLQVHGGVVPAQIAGVVKVLPANGAVLALTRRPTPLMRTAFF